MAEQLYFVQTPIGRLPLLLACLSNGNIVINWNFRYGSIGTIIDYSAEGMIAVFDKDVFRFTMNDNVEEYEEIFEYGEQITYKKEPLLLKWLQAQNLPNPLEKNEQH